MQLEVTELSELERQLINLRKQQSTRRQCYRHMTGLGKQDLPHQVLKILQYDYSTAQIY